MISLRNRRSKRALFATFATGVLILGPSIARAQEVTVQTPKTHTVKKGDTLWDLAQTYLGDAFRWPELYRLNTDVVEDPHWIYPGEILKLPGYIDTTTPGLAQPGRDTVGITPPVAVPITVDSTQRPFEPKAPTRFARSGLTQTAPGAAAAVTGDSTATAARPTVEARPSTTVLTGDYLRAPWLMDRKGPPVWGRILGSADIPGILPAQQRGRFQLNDRILIAPPTGYVGPEHELYLTYRDGPRIEDVGQIIVPTGVVEVLRPPVNGEAAIARIVRMFKDVNEHDRLMPYDSSSLAIVGLPTPVKNGAEGEVRWVLDEPVLPSVTYFVVLSLTSSDGVKPGDEVELFRERQKAREEGEYAIPEIHIGRAQIVRVTDKGATAMITRLEQPKVETGTKVRVVAKMQ